MVVVDGAFRTVRRNWLFLSIVVAPFVVVAAYLLLFAADRYQAEARFVVRSPGLSANAAVGALISGGSMIKSVDDSYAINSYILSHDALDRLETKLDIRAILGRAGRDPLWAFPGLFGKATSEALFRQYERLVSVKLDKSSGITSLTVQAFRPEDAVLIASALLDDAERLANNLSVRSRDDAVRTAAIELALSKERVDRTQEKITEFRNRERVVDPARISNAVVEIIARLSLEIAQINAQLIELQRAAPQSPQISSLKGRIAALERQITREREQLAGTDRALAQKISDYEKLVIEKDFAEKMLTSAANSVETARLDVKRQQLYIERIVSPSQPDWPNAPSRLTSLALTVLLSLLVFSAARSALGHRGGKSHP
jgi:capsular polysaccharide transport system permease protein